MGRQDAKNENAQDGFFSDLDTYNQTHPDTPADNYRVNIPVKDVIDSYNQNSYYSGKKGAADIPISKNQRLPKEERYDHNAYQAMKEKERREAEQSVVNHLPPEKKEEKSGCGCSTAFICILLVVALAAASLYGYIFALSGKVQKAELEKHYTSEAVGSTYVKNILLIGLDKAEGGVSRSDSMMLLSIDTRNRALKLTSFMRDMWVSIPNHYNAKLNAAYAYGGAQLTIDTIESNFKIAIDHYVLVDFDMFEQIIDSLGGVTVDITENEAAFLRSHTRVKVPAGTNTLSGEYALIYSRIRKLDSDFNRTQRQRKVMTAIIEKAKKTNPLELASMLSDIMPLITTDISQKEMTSLAFSALRYIQYDIDQLQIPANGTYSSQMISGQAALVPNMETNKSKIFNFIYG